MNEQFVFKYSCTHLFLLKNLPSFINHKLRVRENCHIVQCTTMISRSSHFCLWLFYVRTNPIDLGLGIIRTINSFNLFLLKKLPSFNHIWHGSCLLFISMKIRLEPVIVANPKPHKWAKSIGQFNTRKKSGQTIEAMSVAKYF